MYFSLICESVENTTFLKSYNFVTILLHTFSAFVLQYIYDIFIQHINFRFLNVSSNKKKLSTFVGGFLRLYTRYLCILMRKHIGTPFFVPGGLVGNSLGKKCSFVSPNTMFLIDTLPPTHTTHTYTHKYGASFSVTLGVVTSADVCVCSCRGRKQTIRRVCSISLRIFDIEF